MRRPFLALALVIIALLALCGFVLGVFAVLANNNLAMQISELKQQLQESSKPSPTPAPTPTPSGTTGGSTGGNTSTPPSGSSCVGENEVINVSTPDAKCCSGLIKVDATAGELLQGITARCVGV